MAPLGVLLVCELITLAGSTATTAWLISFLIFKETLAPYRWELFLGGFGAIAVGELGSWLIARSLARPDPDTE